MYFFKLLPSFVPVRGVLGFLYAQDLDDPGAKTSSSVLKWNLSEVSSILDRFCNRS